MRLWIVSSAFFLVILIVSADEIDLGLNNPELVAKTVQCLEGKGPCSKFGQKAKVVLSQIAREGECKSCSKEEQEKAYEVIKRFRKQHPTVYTRLLAKYRPSGVPSSGVPDKLKDLAGDRPRRQ